MCKIENGRNPNRYKFSWIELIVNTKTGETSATGFCGMLLVAIPLALFTTMVLWYFFHATLAADAFEIMDKLITLIGIGSGLLGLRKLSAAFPGNKISIGGGSSKDDDDEEDQPRSHRSTKHLPKRRRSEEEALPHETPIDEEEQIVGEEEDIDP